MTLSIWEKKGSLAEQYWNNGHADFEAYDMHGHMGYHNAIYFKRCQPDTMAEHLKRCHVKRLVFSHHESLWGERRCQEDYETCKMYPDVYRMYVSLNPNYPENIREDLAKFDSWQPYAVGLKFLPDYHQVSVLDKRYEYALKFADERGLPCLFHTWGGSKYDGGAQMFELVQKYHNMKFLLGHCIFGEWEYAERCVNESAGNVYLELTAIPGENGIIERLVKAVGSEKIFYGTDMPWFDEYQVIGGVLSADITEDDMRNILYRNAKKLLHED